MAGMKMILRSWLVSWLSVGTLYACASTLCEGLRHFYNGEYSEAGASFDQLIALEPSNPVGYWRKLMSEYFRLRRDRNTDTPELDDAEYETLIATAAKGIAAAEAKIRNDERPNFHRFVKASTLSILAALHYSNGKPGRARATIAQAVKVAEESHYQDAGFVVGSINYEIAQRFPHGLRWIAFGLPHDEIKGGKLILRSAINNHSPFADDVKFFIFHIETENNGHANYTKTQIENLWKDLYGKYPKNRMLVEYDKRVHPH